MTLSNDLRQRVVQAYRDKEGSQRAIAQRFKIVRSTLQSWLREDEQPSPHVEETRGRPCALGEDGLKRLGQVARLHKDASEEELARLLSQEGYAEVHRSSIGRALRQMGLTRKKRRGEQVNKTDLTSRMPDAIG